MSPDREHPSYLLPLAASLVAYVAGKGDLILPVVVFLLLLIGYRVPTPRWWRFGWTFIAVVVLAAIAAYFYQGRFLSRGILLYVIYPKYLATAAVLGNILLVMLWYLPRGENRGWALLLTSFLLVALSGNETDRKYFIPAIVLYFLCLVIHFKIDQMRNQQKGSVEKLSDSIFYYTAFVTFIISTVLAGIILIIGMSNSESLIMSLAAEANRLYEGRGRMNFGSSMKLGSFSASINDQEMVMSLEGKGPITDYLRCQVFNEYQKGAWRENRGAPGRLPPKPAPGGENIYFVDDKGDIKWDYSVSLMVSMGRILPALENTSAVSAGSQVLYDESSALFSVSPEDSPIRYTIKGELNHLPSCSGECIEKALIVPENLRLDLNEKAQQITGKFETEAQKARAVKEYMSGFDYSLEPQLKAGVDPVLDFILNRQSGFCQDFASAAALLLRSAGVPARVVTGFIIRELGQHGAGTYIVRRRDAHAWCEFYNREKDHWVSLDTTPLDSMNRALGLENPTWTSMMTDKLTIRLRFLSDYIHGFNLREFLLKVDPVKIGYGIAVVVGAVFVLVLISRRRQLFGGFRRARAQEVRETEETRVHAEITGKYLELLKLLEARGVQFKDSDTSEEVLYRIESSGAQARKFYPTCKEFIQIYNQARFKAVEQGELDRSMNKLNSILENLNQ